MNGIAAIFVAATLTLLSVHTAPTQVVANRDVRSDARPCPCTFGITVSERVPNFDVLVLRTSALASRTQDAQHLPFIPLLSRLNQTSQQASRFDERLQYIHHLHIPVQGSFTLVLRFAPPLPPPDVQPESHLHVLTTRLGRQSSTCPVRLPQHPPQTNPDAEKTPSLRIASVHPRERHTTGENWRTQSLPLRAAQARQERVASARRVSAASRIIGGDLANADLANYLVLLQTLVPIGIASCSGTLVSPTVIITAAHCMLDMTTQVIFQRSLGIPSTRYIHVSSVHIYPDYYGNISSPRSPSVDIAYVRLESRAPLWAKFMKVNMNRSIPVESSFVRNAGYGITNQSQEMSNENFNLYQVDVPLVRDRLCAWIYGIPWQSVLDGRIVCAGYSYKSGCGAWYVIFSLLAHKDHYLNVMSTFKSLTIFDHVYFSTSVATAIAAARYFNMTRMITPC